MTKARPKANIKLVTTDPVAWIAAAKGDTAQAALNAGLADKLGDEVAFGERVKQVARQIFEAGEVSLAGIGPVSNLPDYKTIAAQLKN